MIPVGMAAAGWAAISAIGGALVGATAGGAIDWLLKHKADAAVARAGARLMISEFGVLEQRLTHARENAERFPDMQTWDGLWRDYRGVLAQQMQNDDFDYVAATLISVREALDEINRQRSNGLLHAESVHALDDQITKVRLATKALAQFVAA